MDSEVDLVTRSLGHQLSELETTFEEVFSWPDPRSAFARFVLEPTALRVGENPLHVPEERLGETPVLSSCGYLIALAGSRGEKFPLTETWHEHVKRRFEQKIVSRKRDSFFFRPYDLLGIALGLQYLEAAEAEVSTLKGAMQGGHKHYQNATPARQLVASAAAKVMAADWGAPPVSAKNASLEALSLSYWLRSADVKGFRGFAFSDSLSDVATRILQKALRRPVVPQRPEVQDVAVVYYALDEIVSRSVERFGIGFRNQERKSKLEEQRVRRSQALRSVEKAEARIEKKSKRARALSRVLVSGALTLPMAVLELYFVGALGEQDNPFSISDLPSKLAGYLSEGGFPIAVASLLAVATFASIYQAGKTAEVAEWCGETYKRWLQRKWLQHDEST